MKRFDPFALDLSNECLWRNGVRIPLPPRPFSVLQYLVEHPGRLVTQDEMLESLWPETFVQPQVIRTYIQELRKLLDDDAREPRFIQTIPKRGYCFAAKVYEGTESNNEQGPQPTEPCSLVGRETELSRLLAIAGEASEGKRQIVFLTGEAGIGKSALLQAFRARLSSEMPVNVACGECLEGLGAREDYYPVSEALRELCASQDSERIRKLLTISAWLPDSLGEPPNGRSSNLDRSPQRSLASLCRALEEISAKRMLFLIFEDLHLADPATLELISALGHRHSVAKLIVLATARPLGSSYSGQLRRIESDLLLHRLATEITLHPLSRRSVSEMVVRQIAKESLSGSLEDLVYHLSEGNPLFVNCIVEHLISENNLAPGNAPAPGQPLASFLASEATVPRSLTQMIEIEIERLDPADLRVLEAGSLLSVAFPAWAVAAVLQQDEAETEAACDDLARRLSFVRTAGCDELPGGRQSNFYVFAHSLYRQVLYRRQSQTRRARGHRRIAEKLTQIFAGRESCVAREMAAQLEAAAEWRGAVAALCVAARHAFSRNACSEAEELLDRALRLATHLTDQDRGSATEEVHAVRTLAQQSTENAPAKA